MNRNVSWLTDDLKKNATWRFLAIDVYFPSINTLKTVQLHTCIGSFHRYQILNIIGYVTRVLASLGYKKVNIPKSLEMGSLIIGAHPGAMKHSELDHLGDLKIEGPLYPAKKFHKDPWDRFEKCQKKLLDTEGGINLGKIFFPHDKTEQRGMDCFPNAVNFLLRSPLFTSREQICRLIEKN